MSGEEKVTITDAGYAQALLDQADAEVRRVAKKYGVPPEWMERAIRDFAHELTPHAGREPSVHSVSHYKRWFKGYAAGLRAKSEERRYPDISIGSIVTTKTNVMQEMRVARIGTGVNAGLIYCEWVDRAADKQASMWFPQEALVCVPMSPHKATIALDPAPWCAGDMALDQEGQLGIVVHVDSDGTCKFRPVNQASAGLIHGSRLRRRP